MNKLNNWLKSSFRLVLTVFVCGLLFISSADKDKMISPEEADATTVKEKAANFLDNLTN
ncbi:MAG: hypothetical protein WBM44_19575 [Waterburya sp.]